MNSISRHGALLLAVPALLLTGCGENGAASSPTVTVTETVSATSTPSTSSTPAAATGKLSPRGALMKQSGEMAGLGAPNGDSLIEFTVQSIEADPVCTGRDPRAPENGTFVALDVDLEVFPGAEENYVDGNLVNPNSFRFIGTDGATFGGDVATASTYTCLPPESLLNTQVGDGERTSGTILLDLPEDSGTLLLEDEMSGNKWEWNF